MQHKWHKEIKAWADGAEIEVKNSMDINQWILCVHPNWSEGFTEEVDWIEYRIKPTFEQEYIRKMAEKALSIPEISKAVDRVFEAFREPQPKEPQYLYAYRDFGGQVRFYDTALHRGQMLLGKIKLEDNN